MISAETNDVLPSQIDGTSTTNTASTLQQTTAPIAGESTTTTVLSPTFLDSVSTAPAWSPFDSSRLENFATSATAISAMNASDIAASSSSRLPSTAAMGSLPHSGFVASFPPMHGSSFILSDSAADPPTLCAAADASSANLLLMHPSAYPPGVVGMSSSQVGPLLTAAPDSSTNLASSSVNNDSTVAATIPVGAFHMTGIDGCAGDDTTASSLSPASPPPQPTASAPSYNDVQARNRPTPKTSTVLPPWRGVRSAPTGKSLFVSRLDKTVDFLMLRDTFGRYGKVVSTRVLFDAVTGLSRGIGYVNFERPEDAGRAIDELNNTYAFPNATNAIAVKLADEDSSFAAEETNKIFARNIPNGTTVAQVKHAFSQFGIVTSCTIHRDNMAAAGSPQGIMTYLSFEEVESAVESVARLNGRCVFDGMVEPLFVKLGETAQVRKIRLDRLKRHEELRAAAADGQQQQQQQLHHQPHEHHHHHHQPVVFDRVLSPYELMASTGGAESATAPAMVFSQPTMATLVSTGGYPGGRILSPTLPTGSPHGIGGGSGFQPAGSVMMTPTQTFLMPTHGGSFLEHHQQQHLASATVQHHQHHHQTLVATSTPMSNGSQNHQQQQQHPAQTPTPVSSSGHHSQPRFTQGTPTATGGPGVGQPPALLSPHQLHLTSPPSLPSAMTGGGSGGHAHQVYVFHSAPPPSATSAPTTTTTASSAGPHQVAPAAGAAAHSMSSLGHSHQITGHNAAHSHMSATAGLPPAPLSTNSSFLLTPNHSMLNLHACGTPAHHPVYPPGAILAGGGSNVVAHPAALRYSAASTGSQMSLAMHPHMHPAMMSVPSTPHHHPTGFQFSGAPHNAPPLSPGSSSMTPGGYSVSSLPPHLLAVTPAGGQSTTSQHLPASHSWTGGGGGGVPSTPQLTSQPSWSVLPPAALTPQGAHISRGGHSQQQQLHHHAHQHHHHHHHYAPTMQPVPTTGAITMHGGPTPAHHHHQQSRTTTTLGPHAGPSAALSANGQYLPPSTPPSSTGGYFMFSSSGAAVSPLPFVTRDPTPAQTTPPAAAPGALEIQ